MQVQLITERSFDTPGGGTGNEETGIRANTLLEVHKMYNAVGIDVSYTSQDLHELTDYLGSLDGSTKIFMECTDRYHEPMVKALSEAGLQVLFP